MRTIFTFMQCFVTLLAALPGVLLAEGVPVTYIPAAPTPAQVKTSKQAFDRGDIVAMKGGTIAGFEALLNVVMPQSDSRHRQPPPCVQAARKMPSGQVKKYLRMSRPFVVNDDAACQNSFLQWTERQDSLKDTNVPNWTAIENLSLSSAWTSLPGNSISLDVSVYRANTINPEFDYYLCLYTNTMAEGSGYTGKLSNAYLNYGATYSNGVNADSFAYGPGAGSSTIAIGQSIQFAENASGTYTASQVTTPFIVNGGSPTPLTWEYDNLSSNQLQTAIIYRVPAGTTRLTLSASSQAAFAFPLDTVNRDSGSVLIPVSAPQVLVPALTFAMQGTTSSFDVTVSPYLQTLTSGLPGWMPPGSIQFTDPNGEVTQTPPTGFSSFTVSFNIPLSPPCLNDQTCANPGTYTLQTSPPFAALQTRPQPISSTTIEFVQNSPKAGVLIAGGQDWDGNVLKTVDLWDSETGAVTTPASYMVEARYQHTATLVAPSSPCQSANTSCPTVGQVLIAGGLGANGQALNSTEFFNYANDQFTQGPSMTSAHAGAVALQLQDGRILIMGGLDQSGSATSVVDIYDPLTNSFSSTPMHLTLPRWNFAASLLQDGSVLVQGGSNDPSNYDGPATNTAEKLDNCGIGFNLLTHNLVVGRQALAATVLKNGQVFSVGGYNGDVDGGNALNETELFTPNSESFSQITQLQEGGVRWASAILQEDGKVAVIGGFNTPNILSTFDPASLSYVAASNMTEQRDFPTAVRLEGIGTADKGKILVAGGVYPSTGSTNGELVELYDPTAQSWTSAGMLSASRRQNTTTLYGKYAGSLPSTLGCH